MGLPRGDAWHDGFTMEGPEANTVEHLGVNLLCSVLHNLGLAFPKIPVMGSPHDKSFYQVTRFGFSS